MTILMLETIDEGAMPTLSKVGKVVVSPSPIAHQLDLPFDEVTAIVTRGLGQLDRALMDKCPNLKVIARCGAGLNNLDLNAAEEKGVDVVFAPGINAAAVAEHTLMLILMLVRKGFACSVDVKRDHWASRNEFSGDDLAGKKICIVGSGNIGEKVATLCRVFAMDVVVCGRNGGGIEGLKTSLRHHLPNCDIVSLHIPLNTDTHHLFGRDVIAAMKNGATLINTARGELVDPDALLDALNDGTLAGYGADVVEGEVPASGDPIVNHAQTVITPHVAAMTGRTYREMSVFTAENLAAVLTGKTPAPESLYRGAA